MPSGRSRSPRKSNDQVIAERLVAEAIDIVYHQRMEDYGDPEDSFDAIGRVWSALLSRYLREYIPDLPGWLVAQMMVNLKIVREVNAHKEDNLRDQVGYTLLAERQRRREGSIDPAEVGRRVQKGLSRQVSPGLAKLISGMIVEFLEEKREEVK